MADHPEDRIICFAARRIEEDVRQAVLRQPGDLLREENRRWRRRLEECVVKWQLPHLFGSNVDELVPSIADIHAPKPGHAIKDAIAVPVMDITAFGMSDDPAAAKVFYFLPIGLGGKVMRDIEAAKFCDVVIARHWEFSGIG